MSTATAGITGSTSTMRSISAVERATSVLRLTFGLVPVAAGADKFMHLLTNWDQYLAPAIANLLPLSVNTFMLIVGVIEIVAGVIVLLRPRIGSLIVSAWLAGIAINLLIGGIYLDIAVCDLVMAIAAYSLFLLSGDRKN